MRKRWKAVLWILAALAVAFFAFASWYKREYSMEVAKAIDVNPPNLDRRVLIATQGSEFKDAVVAGVLKNLEGRPVYVKVVDVSALEDVNAAEWSAVVVLHTWENWKPQPDARAFVERVKNENAKNVFVLATSGAGDFHMEGVDGVSSASTLENVPSRVSEILSWLEPRLEPEAPTR